MAERNIHKTIRITQEAYDYIAKFSGTTWNDQFNNMVNHVIHFQEDRDRKIKDLDAQITARKESLQKLDEVISNAKSALGVSRYW